MKQRQQTHLVDRNSPLRPQPDKSDWVETTTVRPRERPRAGKNLQQQPPVTAPQLNRYSQASTHTRSIPSVDLLGLSPQTTSMTRSLDSTKTTPMFASVTNPFGDDFGKFDPSNSSAKLDISEQTTRGTVPHQPQQQLSGFEDSFADLLIQPSALPSQSQVTWFPSSHIIIYYYSYENTNSLVKLRLRGTNFKSYAGFST